MFLFIHMAKSLSKIKINGLKSTGLYRGVNARGFYLLLYLKPLRTVLLPLIDKYSINSTYKQRRLKHEK